MALNVGFIANPATPKIDIVDPLEQQSKQIQLRQLLTGEQDDRTQRDAMTQSGGDAAKYLQALAAGGNYKAYQAAQKAGLDAEKARADVTHTGAQTGKLLSETEEMQIKRHRDNLAGVNDPQTAAQWIQSGYADPVIGKRMASLAPLDQAISRIPQDPAGFQQWKQQQALGATKYIEMNKPSYQTRNLGGTTDTIALPGLGGTPAVVSSQRNTPSPESLITQATAIRGQNMTDARAKEANEAGKWQYDPSRGVSVNPRTGEARPVMQGGQPLSAKDAAKENAKVTDAKDVLSLLDQAGPLIDKATNSYAGVGIDEVGRAFGGATEGAKAAAQLRALEGALISKMPKMSGPQSDKDVLLYKQMAGQIGDRTIPAEQKKAAMQTIRQINERHAGQNGVTGDFQASPAKTKAGASVSNW